MTANDVMVDQPPSVPAGTWLGHPSGLYLLFATEMWERFCYYGMRALVVYTLTKTALDANPGFGFTEAQALRLYSYYTAATYLTPMLGGWLADRYLGQRRSVIIGGVIMAIGQFMLAASVPGSLSLYYLGLVVYIMGNGFFKANISTMVGYLYREGDSRRDGAFSIFYMGINLGAFIAPFICSTYGEDPQWGWRYGYAFAGCGMLLSVVIQMAFARRFLGEIGMRPSAARALAEAGGRHEPLTGIERDRLRVILMLLVFVILFWTAFEQGGGLMAIFAEQKTDRMLGSFEVPAGWFQSLNPAFIFILAPLFAMLWSSLGARGRSPAAPVKIIFGLLLTAVGFGFLVFGVFDQEAHGKASMIWLVLAFLFHTLGELCISPVGLSMVTKLSPPRLASVIMGIWFLNNFLGNFIAGQLGAFSEKFGDLAIFGGVGVTLVVFSAGLWAVSGILVTWMHGAETVTS